MNKISCLVFVWCNFTNIGWLVSLLLGIKMSEDDESAAQAAQSASFRGSPVNKSFKYNILR